MFGASKCVLFIEVSWFQGVLIKDFHCKYSLHFPHFPISLSFLSTCMYMYMYVPPLFCTGYWFVHVADDVSVSTTMADSELARKNFITNLPLPPDDLVGCVEIGMMCAILHIHVHVHTCIPCTVYILVSHVQCTVYMYVYMYCTQGQVQFPGLFYSIVVSVSYTCIHLEFELSQLSYLIECSVL